MVRWEPDTRTRLQVAALELYDEQGFEQTTVAQIAARVGLTERTFFRHFADKREVLFDGQDALAHAFTGGVAGAPPGATPLGLVAAGLDAAAGFFPEERRPWARRRQAVVGANAGLHEREQLKMESLGAAVAGSLRARGVAEPAATLAARSGVTVFVVAFAAWVGADEERSMLEVQREVLAGLTAVTASA